MDFSGGHVQALLNTIQNYPIRTSTPSNNADEIIDRFLQNYPQYANMDFSGGHVQALLNIIQNYPINPQQQPQHISLPPQPDLSLTLGRGRPQGGYIIPFDHQKGQNELRQRMVQYILQLPQEFRQDMTNYMHYLLMLLPKPQTPQHTQTTSEGDQAVPADPPLTLLSIDTLNFLHDLDNLEFYGTYRNRHNEFIIRSGLRSLLRQYIFSRLNEYQVDGFGNVSKRPPQQQQHHQQPYQQPYQQFYQQPPHQPPQQHFPSFPHVGRAQTGIRLQERPQAQYQQLHHPSHQQQPSQRPRMMLQPHPNPAFDNRGKLPTIEEASERHSSDSDDITLRSCLDRIMLLTEIYKAF
uniref:Uncharacterized protein n=1 Tax=Meloidogyne enterolobii TaxID=390850 RepID=A0A6V7W5B7_MELEN|nr:unnamed protein product [Meloidogyne enterolobii]